MDAVKSFNLELSGLYEVKPPISKAKMTSITKGAIKAIKFYKHVVQSVEKFILKCKPEYKVPGLYVIDSIVRQSRHQFGADRDVFAPRFAKNLQQTFINLFSCPEEEKSKVIRVLNLWQKNQVFPPEVIQPLFDLADPNHPVYKEQNLNQSNGVGNLGILVKGSPALQKSPVKSSTQGHGADLHTGAANMQLHKTLQKQGVDGGKIDGQAVRFDRTLLDFDYDDEEEEDPQHVNPSPKQPLHNPSSAIETVGSLLSNPEVLRQLQTLQQSMSQSQQYQELDLEKLRKLQEMKQQEEEFDKHLAQTVPNLPFASECELKPLLMNPPPPSSQPYYMTGIQDIGLPPPGYKPPHSVFEIPNIQDIRAMEADMQSRGVSKEVTSEVEVINLDQTDSRSPSPNVDRHANRRRRSRSRERSRDRGRGKDRDRRSKRSRSRSHSRDQRRRQRTRSREKDRNRDRERDKEREREKDKDREKEKERKKRGLPPFKKEHLCVCSTTLWVGHLSKLVHQEELSDAFGEYGGIVSIDLIPPRGCAFIVMHRRQDAARCLEKLKNHKLQGKAITIAWAPGKGLKGKDLKDYWEVDLGVSYIPWPKVKHDIDIELLEDGGMIDEDSMPPWMKAKIAQSAATVMASPHIAMLSNIPGMPNIPSLANLDTSQPPPMAGANMLQPPPALPLQMVNPFQLNLGISMPPSIMSNVPLGVPPPNMPPPAMMTNQMLGFAQGPAPTLLPPPMSMPTPTKLPPMHKPVQPFSLVQIPQIFHDDNMDVEMEDVDKSYRPPPLSDQLLASLSHSNDESSNLTAALTRLNAVTGNKGDAKEIESQEDNKRKDNDKDESSRYHSDRDHREPRDYRDSRDHKGGSDYRDGRDRREVRDHRDRHDFRRERTNRWGDREDYNERRDDRRDSSDKNLNDRLREMAHQDYLPKRDGSQTINKENTVSFEPPVGNDIPSLLDGNVFSSRFNNDDQLEENDMNSFMNPEPPSDTVKGVDENAGENFNDWQKNEWDNNQNGVDTNTEQGNNFDEESNNFNMPPPLFERNIGLHHPRGNFKQDDSHRLPHITVRNEIFLKDERFRDNDFNQEHNAFDMGPTDFEHPEFEPRDDSLLGPGPVDPMYGGEELHGGFGQDGPMFDDQDDGMYNEQNQFHSQFGGPDRARGGFGPEHGRRGFSGPGFGGRDYGGPPGRGGFRGRDMHRGFGGRDRGRRGGGFGDPRGEFWNSRGMRGGSDGFRPRGGFFPPRGQGRPPRLFGPRRNEGGDRNFQQRFDGPPDFFRGNKFDEHPRRNYDDSRSRSSRRDDRRTYRRDFEEEHPPHEKRSRWGNSPKRSEESITNPDNSENEPTKEFSSEKTTEQVVRHVMKVITMQVIPLHYMTNHKNQ